MKQRISLRLILLAIFSLFSLCQQNSWAQGDLLVFPKRLEFEGKRDRVKILNLHNKGTDTVVYRISYREFRMEQDGSFTPITEPDKGQHFASPFLRFYPRSVTLAPNETQVVKVQLIKTSELKAGEYRSHLFLRGIPDIEKIKEEARNSSDGLEVNLVPSFGITVANIIQNGDANVKVQINDTSLEWIQNKPFLDLSFYREGEFSSYGDIEILYRYENGREVEVGKVQGFAIYTPGSVRTARIELKRIEDSDYKNGQLIVRYISRDAAKPILAEKKLNL